MTGRNPEAGSHPGTIGNFLPLKKEREKEKNVFQGSVRFFSLLSKDFFSGLLKCSSSNLIASR